MQAALKNLKRRGPPHPTTGGGGEEWSASQHEHNWYSFQLGQMEFCFVVNFYCDSRPNYIIRIWPFHPLPPRPPPRQTFLIKVGIGNYLHHAQFSIFQNEILFSRICFSNFPVSYPSSADWRRCLEQTISSLYLMLITRRSRVLGIVQYKSPLYVK